MKYINRSRTEPGAFVGLLNDEETNTVVTMLVGADDQDGLPVPEIIEIGNEVYSAFRREAATANQISSETDSHRYTVLDAQDRAVGTLYVSRPRDPDREVYAVMYPPRGADTAEALSRVAALRAKLSGNKDPNDKMPF